MRFVGVIAALLALAGTGWYLGRAVPAGTALVAKQLCSLIFVSALPEELAFETWILPHTGPLGRFVRTTVDRQAGRVTAVSLGLVREEALHVPGFGCTLPHGQRSALTPLPEAKAPVPVAINVRHRDRHFDSAALDRALDRAMSEPAPDAPRRTAAVVVLHDGKLVGERYAAGIDQTTPLPGYSMAKSVTTTLIGLLAQHRKFDVHAPVPFAIEPRQGGDPPLTTDHLLRMTSGINIVENETGADTNAVMLMRKPDAAAYAVERGLRDPPGAVFAYNGGNTLLAAKILRDALGPDPNSAFTFARRELLEPLGLWSFVMEADVSGTFWGSSFLLASALDWARLGQLYLQDGVWKGRRLLPEGWVTYVTTPTNQSGESEYGAGFWLARRGSRERQEDVPRRPRDAFFMHGMLGQSVTILPSHELVIARLGATRCHLDSGEWDLVRDVVASLAARPEKRKNAKNVPAR